MSLTIGSLKKFMESISSVADDETEIYLNLSGDEDIFDVDFTHEANNPIMINVKPDIISGAIFIEYTYNGDVNHAKFEIDINPNILHKFIDTIVVPIFVSANKDKNMKIENITIHGSDIFSAYAIYRELDPYNYNISIKLLN